MWIWDGGVGPAARRVLRLLRRLIRAGFSQRVMFGSDHMYWPDLIGMSVDAVDSAPFLTPAEKRDIFHDNAVRFYKLQPAGERKTP
jgi:predicted TIM-barrel fold metal-dependent hydrolase